MGIQINGQTDTVTATDGSINIGGNVTVPGVLTYEDVTSVDAVGIVTAQSGINVTGTTAIGNEQLQLTWTSPNGAIKAKNTVGSPAANLDLYSTDTGGNTNLGIRLQYTGNVGIGTDNPSGKFDVFDTSRIKHVVASNSNHIEFWKDSTPTYAASIGLGVPAAGSLNQDLIFSTYGGSWNERLRITSGGTLESYSPDDTTPNIKWRSNDTNWYGSLNQSVEGGTITSFLSCGGDWSANGTTYSATKALAAYPTSAIAIHNQYNSTWGSEFVFLTKAGGSTTTDGAVTEKVRINSSGKVFLPGTQTDSNEAGRLDIYHTADDGINNPHIRLWGPANQDARIEFGSPTNTGEGGYIMYNDSDEGLYIGSRMAGYAEVNLCTGMNDGSPTSNIRLRIDSAGHVTKPSQPCFLAYRSTTQNYTTNDAIVFDTEVFDNNADYDDSNGIFTAPVTGRYLILATVLVQGISQGNQFDFQLATSNRNYYGAPGRNESQLGTTWGNDYIALGVQQIADMDANDTAFLKFTTFEGGSVYGSTGGNLWTRFSAYLLC